MLDPTSETALSEMTTLVVSPTHLFKKYACQIVSLFPGTGKVGVRKKKYLKAPPSQ